MKNIITIILCLCMINTLSICNCSSVKGLSEIYELTNSEVSSWKLNTTNKNGSILYSEDSLTKDTVFCLEPEKEAYIGENQRIKTFSTKRPFSLIALIVWYGYRSKDNPTADDYFLTQNMIWQHLGYDTYYYSDEYPDKKSMQNWLDDIEKKVEYFTEFPSFHGNTYDLKVGETIEITDENNVLESLIVSTTNEALSIQKENNTLKITALKQTARPISISLKKDISTFQSSTSNYFIKNNEHDSQILSPCFGSTNYTSSININIYNGNGLRIVKKDDTNLVVPYASFIISYNEDMSNPIGTYTTDFSGTVLVKDLLPQTIYIQEKNVSNKNLIADTNIYSTQIYEDRVTPYFAINKYRTGTLNIIKKDDKGNLVSDTSFKLSYKSDMTCPIGIYTTNNEGHIIIDNLKTKTIYMQEIKTPEHLILNSSIKSTTITENQIKTYTFTNNTKLLDIYDLSISKTIKGNASSLNKKFEFSILLNDPSINGLYGNIQFINGKANCLLTHGQTLIAKGLPAHISYTISEHNYEDYSTRIKLAGNEEWINNHSISGVLDSHISIEFENTKDLAVPTFINIQPVHYFTICLTAFIVLIIIKKYGLL